MNVHMMLVILSVGLCSMQVLDPAQLLWAIVLTARGLSVPLAHVTGVMSPERQPGRPKSAVRHT